MGGPYCAAVLILHLMTAGAWHEWRSGRPYAPASLATEGFVHCTAGDDLMLDVANRFYRGHDDLVAVTVDPALLGSEVRWERAADPAGSRPWAGGDGPRFPHVYGPLEREAVVDVRRMVQDGDGRFSGYEPMA
jgi:uncharacterized protein (DUF952 family)